MMLLFRLKHMAGQHFIVAVDIVPKVEQPVLIHPGGEVNNVHRHFFLQRNGLLFRHIHRFVHLLRRPPFVAQ